jgi:hypothetical protein
MSDDPTGELRNVLDNLTDPAVKARWDSFAGAYNRRQVSYRFGDAEGNQRAYDAIIYKLAQGQINAKWVYNKSFDVLSEAKRSSHGYVRDKYELALLRDGLDLETWELADEIVRGLRECFLQDVHAFIAAFAEQYRERVGAQILPRIKQLDRSRGEFMVANTVHILYIVIDIAVE